MARVKSYGDVLREYEYHPKQNARTPTVLHAESKPLGCSGRCHISIDGFTYIGKESNKLEEIEEQGGFDPGDVYTEYPNPERDDWVTKILPEIATQEAFGVGSQDRSRPPDASTNPRGATPASKKCDHPQSDCIT